MRKLLSSVALVSLLSVASVAEAKPKTWGFLAPVRNAKYVYVTSYDGSQFSRNLLPEDRAAISAVQSALSASGRYTVVYRPEEAEMILVVKSWPSEDVLAVYDAHSWGGGNYLWRATARHGLSAPNLPLFRELEAALERVS
jgi:hypothetical protein